jgi:hypothetical protein
MWPRASAPPEREKRMTNHLAYMAAQEHAADLLRAAEMARARNLSGLNASMDRRGGLIGRGFFRRRHRAALARGMQRTAEARAAGGFELVISRVQGGVRPDPCVEDLRR